MKKYMVFMVFHEEIHGGYPGTLPWVHTPWDLKSCQVISVNTTAKHEKEFNDSKDIVKGDVM